MYFDQDLLLSPPTKRAAYSDRMAYIMSAMSELAYLKPEAGERDVLIERLESGDFALVETFDINETQAFIAKNNKFAVLAFRGTEGKWKDILTDLQFRFRDGVHRGFAIAYEYISEDIKLAVKQLGDIPLYITGHSLGAALAMLATQDLDKNTEVAACYTFGCPRVGDATFDKSVKAPVYRVVNAADVVARVPFNLFLRFVHVGDLRYLTKKGELIRNPNMIRRGKWYASNIIRKWKAPGVDHFIRNYVLKLKSIAVMRNTKTEVLKGVQ